MLVGDAARQVDALNGRGIIKAMTAGRLAGQVAAEALAKGDASARQLQAYQDQVGQAMGRQLAGSCDWRSRLPPAERVDRRFARLSAVAATGK